MESREISASEDLKHRWAFLESTEISASEDLNALEKAPLQIMPLWILSRKGAVQIMPFWKLCGKCHFLLRFCMLKKSETILFQEKNHFKDGMTRLVINTRLFTTLKSVAMLKIIEFF